MCTFVCMDFFLDNFIDLIECNHINSQYYDFRYKSIKLICQEQIVNEESKHFEIF